MMVEFLTEDDLTLEVKHRRCFSCTAAEISDAAATGRKSKKKPMPCVFCGGLGFYDHPTSFGRQVLAFIKKYKKELE